jgi:hypothetical protein
VIVLPVLTALERGAGATGMDCIDADSITPIQSRRFNHADSITPIQSRRFNHDS